MPSEVFLDFRQTVNVLFYVAVSIWSTALANVSDYAI
jgi:hypothetical protein